MFVEPLAQEFPDEAVEALTVVVPVATRVASPAVLENVSREVFPEVHVALAVTSLLLLSVAVNWTDPVVRDTAEFGGAMVSVCELPPLVLPVIVPFTPARDAVIVMSVELPTAVTSPVELTEAHAVELCQEAELVTSFVPELKVAVAVNCAVGAAEKLDAPPDVTDIEFG